MPAGRTLLPSSVVIDLTESDEDHVSGAYNQVPRHASFQSSANSTPQLVPVSNRGLTLRKRVNSGEGQDSQKENSFGVRFGSGHGANTSSLSITSAGPIRFAHSSRGGIRQVQNSGNRANRRSAEQYLSNLTFRAEEESVTLANTSKRRKISGGMTTSTISYPLRSREPKDKDAQIHRIQLVNSREALATSSRSCSSIVEVDLLRPTHRGSQVFSQVRSLPDKHLTGPVAKVTNHESDERMLYVLENQVFKHITNALHKFRKSLSKAQRNTIGTKTARKLINEPSFFEDFEAHEWMLSKSYEERLAARAKRYVDKLASRAHGNYKGSQRVGSSSSDTLGFRRGTPSIQFAEDGDQAKIEDPDDSPVSPFYCEEIFEEVSTSMPPFDNLQDTLAKNHFSPSPATSFSNEPSDVIVQDDSEACHDSKPLNAVRQQPSRELRRSSRLSRNHPGIYSDENIAAGPSVDPKNERDTRSKKPSISAIREVQALRLSGLGGAARPYLSFADRNDIHQGFKIIRGKAGRYLSKEELELLEEAVLHVDFCLEEIRLIWVVIMEITNTKMLIGTDLKSQFMSIMVDQESNIPTISRAILDRARRRGQELGWQLLKKRDIAGICAFLQDAATGYMTVKSQFLCLDLNNGLGASFAAPSISTLIRERETWGMAPFRVCQGKQTFNVDIANHIEDSFVRRSEWTDCCGDISAISWTGNHSFICGATAHSDYHNMQYNKPGNLLAGSTTLDTLRAVDAHRIRRPIISSAENAENALESMRQTQDPWLYTSVVSTSYSEVTDHTFTASFDGTVKVWKVSEDGFSMSLCGTWGHDGKVNFVVTSENHGLVATASDVSSNAIRVYKFDEHDIPGACYDTYSGDKAQEQARGLERRDTWAYFPATIQWGKAHAVAKLLLVGYSPRSSTGHEVDIPDEKKNSGELCIWNAEDGQRVQISSARTQNVFEVIWHPSQPIFLAATSPCGTFEPEVKTQIRLFALNKCGTFLHIKTLDCPALDINELTIQPTSLMESYVTASCTDGNTYVWDTSQGDSAIHILGHGDSLDNPIHDQPREVADSGVKFASWGRTVGRFYTGSSDGKVKAWDVRAPRGEAFVRTVLSVSGGISSGAFSKSFSKLVIGDSTGKVHLIMTDDSDLEEDVSSQEKPARPTIDQPITNHTEGSRLTTRRPKLLIPHPEPLPPEGFHLRIKGREQTAQSMARAYLEESQLRLHPDRGIGVIQGPNYADTLLYRYEAHEEEDGSRELRPEWEARQQYHKHSHDTKLQLSRLPDVKSSNSKLHITNMALDLDVSRLPIPVRETLEQDGVDLKFEEHHEFNFEPTPRYGIFKTKD